MIANSLDQEISPKGSDVAVRPIRVGIVNHDQSQADFSKSMESEWNYTIRQWLSRGMEPVTFKSEEPQPSVSTQKLPRL